MKKYNLYYFLKKEFSFVLIKSNKIIYRSKNQGLKPLVFCLKKHREKMKEAIVYDKVIGLAAAMLLEYGHVTEIWTPIISCSAKKYLRDKKVKVVFKKEVKNILNKNGDGLCLMEKLAKEKGAEGIREFWKV